MMPFLRHAYYESIQRCQHGGFCGSAAQFWGNQTVFP